MWQTETRPWWPGAVGMGLESKGAEFVIARVFEAPRERVWHTLTDVEAMKHWWGPAGFTIIAAKLDFREGGTFHGGIKSAEGYKMWAKFEYQEIAPPERLVFINSFSNEAGGITRHPIVPTWPLHTLTSITLEEEPDGKTRTHRPLDAAQSQRGRAQNLRRVPCRDEGDLERHLRPPRLPSREGLALRHHRRPFRAAVTGRTDSAPSSRGARRDVAGRPSMTTLC